MAKNNGLVQAINDLPLVVKIILALPFLDWIVFGVYRILKGHVIAGIVWLFIGAAFGWIIDIVTLVLYGKVTIFA